MEIREFITQLNSVRDLKLIHNFSALKVSLLKLDKLIGMKKVKDAIISQIKYYMINKFKNVPGLDSHMFHTTVLGPPGSGKTTLVEILAEIWICLGLIKVNKIYQEPEPEPEPINIELEALKDNMKKLRRHIIMDRAKISDIKRKISKIKHKDINSACISLNRISSSMNKNVKLYCQTEPMNIIQNVEDEDYEDYEESGMYNFNPSDYVIKLKRDELIGKYVGHTAIKTKEALMKGLDKVIFIDEAYELYNTTSDSSGDSFGMECLSAILNFMNEYSHRCIIVFAGYENLLKETIFRVQPGLERRIAFSFELSEYTPSELVDIYEKQLKEKNWILSEKEKVCLLFEKNKKLFKFGGGDTIRLCLYTKSVYSKYAFEHLIKKEEVNSVIDCKIVKEAIEILRQNTEIHSEKISEPPFGMYL
jgi:hypothetical protein